MPILRRVATLLHALGLEPRRTLRFGRDLPRYLRDCLVYRRQLRASSPPMTWRWLPYLGERDEPAGTARGAYFHQDLLIAQRIFQNQPPRHVDIGSRIDGFVAHVASFRALEVWDIRELKSTHPNLVFRQRDILRASGEEGGEESISCLHALEHFGLGRYGDPLNAQGHRLAWENIHRLLRPGGRFYFSVPLGPTRVEFNAHRVFALADLRDWIQPYYEVRAFWFVDDRGDHHAKAWAELSPAEMRSNLGCDYGCAIFELVKRPRA